jgi:hypothetical protein
MFIHMMKELSLGEYQFVQIAPDRLALRTVMEISATQKESICRLYGPLLPSGVMMDFEQVPALAKTSSGKFRFVFSEMSKSREPS